MSDNGERYPLWIYLGLGLIQGLILLVTVEAWPASQGARAALSGLLVFVLVGTLQAQLLWPRLREAGRWGPLLGCALLLAVLIGWFVWQVNPQRGMRMGDSPAALLLGNLVLLYVLTPFIQAWGSRSGWRFDYPQLYRHAWNNGLILLLAALLTGLFWLLIALWAGLFSMLGIKLFVQLFFDWVFGLIASTAVFAVGVRIGLQRAQVVEALRGILLALCRALLPLTVLIVLLFALCLPFTGLEPLWQTKHAAAILLTLVFAHLLLVNGVFQDGRQSVAYPRVVRLLADASLLVLPLLAALAGYALWLRVQQYGLTPARVLVGLLVVLALLYTAAAATAVLQRGEVWLGGLRRSNPPVALTLAALLVALQTPWFSPQELSAANQFHRLLAGQVDPGQFDWRLFRAQLGEPGRRYLARLEQLLEQPGALPPERVAQLRAGLTRLTESSTQEQAPRVEWLGAEPADSAGVVRELAVWRDCQVRVCSLLAVDLDADGREEVLVLAGSWRQQLPVLAHEPEVGWRKVGQLIVPKGVAASGLVEQVRREGFRPVTPRYQALEIGGVHLEPRLD